MLAVYCIGIVFRDRLKWILWAVLFSYVMLAVCILCKKGGKIQEIWRERGCLLILPLLLLLGAALGSLQAKDNPLDAVLMEKTRAVAEGRIGSITETKSGYRLELSHIQMKLRNEMKNEIYSKGRLLVYCESVTGLQIGNVIRVEGEAVPFAEPENAGQFDERTYYRAQRIACKMQAEKIVVLQNSVDNIREWCRKIRSRMDAVYEEILPAKHAGIVSAILLGDKAELDADTKALYQKNGIAHILAISGLHVSLLGAGLFAIIRKVGSPLLPAAGVTILVLVFYGCLTEFGISTQRAVGMLILAMLAKVLGKSYDSRSACALCGLFILLVNPLQLHQAGFQLSFATALGISYFGQEMEQMKLKNGKRLSEKLMISFLSGFTTQLVTVPIILNWFYEIPVYSVFLNVPVVGLLSAMVFLCILAGFAGLFSYGLGRFFVGGVYLILELYEVLCKLVDRLPFPIWLYGKPGVWGMAGYFSVLLLFFVTAKQIGKRYRHHFRQASYRRRAFLLLGLLPLVFLLSPLEKEAGNEKDIVCVVDFLSVGQGDGAVVRTAAGNTYLVDGGSSSVKSLGEYRLKPWMKYQGISCLEAVFLSHPDSDHTTGVVELLERANSPNDWYRGEIQIKHLILPAAYRTEESAISEEEKGSFRGFDKVIQLASEKGIPVRWLETGDKIIEESAVFTCLHPGEEYPIYDTNDASMVLLLESGEAEILFTGDVGFSGEQKVLQTLRKKRAEQKGSKTVILKVAHHGSNTSTSAKFLEVLQPDIAIISCGKDNRFGHPHKETLERLQTAGSKIVSTPESGTVSVNMGNEVVVLGYKIEYDGKR